MRRRRAGGRTMVERASKFVLVVAGSACFMLILYQYAGPGLSLGAPGGRAPPDDLDLFPTPDPHYEKKYYFPVRELERSLRFDMKGDDVIVFLHIQKTGGTTFGRHLVQNVRLEVPCDCRPGQKKCTCYRPNRRETWLFSRFSTGWSCGLHADWTELTNCVPGVLDRRDPAALRTPRKFYYITLLRDPVSRYLSEWRHVQRGATWKTSLHMCDGRTPTPEELPPCYEGTDWSGCTLQEFMDCPYNLANNRQVRMLADLSLVGCYNLSFIPEGKRAQLLLESAKKNLRGMAFFGLTEFQRKTQYLFERTFNLKFIRPFMQYNSTRAGGVEVDEDTIRRIEELNDLDMQLYDYAKDLFQQRYQYKRQLERREQRLKSREERLLHRAKEALPREDAEEPGRVPTEDYMSHIIEKW
ncbi:heparan-sulfate 6-O-sulfotransferase 1 [Mirounga angustirostris]|uniref:Heparan-sulfate 6-O-sulfotransferase n=11 Tax=Boreoeutheria TaxID=1437010 RepID=G1LBH8_AILME|nr:LOW QUALITY PROTEIN: heparan-sulfate 6-O-sulfotransferase 1 [Ailuropoda melanoleuca]XP_004408962.1 PREDICTED: heparan-sulfate 6-O-sulfotransferase 1 [Odobenus rosmarus divergens]XP_021551513.1 heparan-sulfate 6-O-sulfotransferase 1 [Neomonachus schauinslandi]XP_025713762.1 heparan-sulfate 6-O-sulfotransferase 1 [Callorhinus ursinus]XP_026244350.1 heparan-sulfate 6-O-sulfotransferase 1 [Urocitellus parryii]XP_026366028.1 heparan-sulfate 6-O-sulfotransferase 1 [Ursus arctos]XP_027445012.1 he